MLLNSGVAVAWLVLGYSILRRFRCCKAQRSMSLLVVSLTLVRGAGPSRQPLTRAFLRQSLVLLSTRALAHVVRTSLQIRCYLLCASSLVVITRKKSKRSILVFAWSWIIRQLLDDPYFYRISSKKSIVIVQHDHSTQRHSGVCP